MTPFAWTTAQVLTATDGVLTSGPASRTFAGIGIDSRTIDPTHLFVAITGETHDGHRFLADVLNRGATGVIVADDQLANLNMDRFKAEGITCVAVADTTLALGALARFNRQRGDLTVLAVTGSNGKTSTRMLMEKVITKKFNTLSTSGNLNNHIGLPLTLFRLTSAHQTAVLELGMNHAGEITHLGGICQPDVGIITNVGPAHLEGLGSIDNVARAKGELLHTIRPGGTAILNADDPRVAALADTVDCAVVYFGSADCAQVRADRIRLTESGTTFRLTTPSGDTEVTLETPARVMVANALAAAAAGEVMGVSLDHIRAGLGSFCPHSGRMGIRKLARGIHLMDDSYNANPASMVAAIDTLVGVRADRRCIAVLGDMLELGLQSTALHRDIGRTVGDAGIDRLYVAGKFASAVAEGAMARRMDADRVFTGTKDAIIERLRHELESGDMVLVKGSRGMAMEQVVEAISQWADDR